MARLRPFVGPLIVGIATWCAAGPISVLSPDSATARLAVPASWTVLVLATGAAAPVASTRTVQEAGTASRAVAESGESTEIGPAAHHVAIPTMSGPTNGRSRAIQEQFTRAASSSRAARRRPA